MSTNAHQVVRVATMAATALTLATATAGAQDGLGSAQGKVVGPGNQPQQGVPVTIQGPLGTTTAITDKTGTWSLYNLPAGNYDVKLPADKSNAVTFSVKDPSFFDKLTGAKAPAVQSPALMAK